MKYLLAFLFIIFFKCAFAQTETDSLQMTTNNSDTIPKYIQVPYLPTFSIQTPDSVWFSKSELPAKKAVLLLYFSPDCGHCILETEEMVSKMKHLEKLQIIMVTSKPFDELKTFADHYMLHRFSNVKIGRDPQRTITRFYEVKFTPFSALYNKKGKLVKAWEKGIDWDELIGLLGAK